MCPFGPPLAQGGSGPLQSGGHAPLAVTSLTQAEYGRNQHVAGALAYSHGAQQVMSLSALAKTANVLPKVVEYNHMNAKEWLDSVSHLCATLQIERVLTEPYTVVPLQVSESTPLTTPRMAIDVDQYLAETSAMNPPHQSVKADAPLQQGAMPAVGTAPPSVLQTGPAGTGSAQANVLATAMQTTLAQPSQQMLSLGTNTNVLIGTSGAMLSATAPIMSATLAQTSASGVYQGTRLRTATLAGTSSGSASTSAIPVATPASGGGTAPASVESSSSSSTTGSADASSSSAASSASSSSGSSSSSSASSASSASASSASSSSSSSQFMSAQQTALLQQQSDMLTQMQARLDMMQQELQSQENRHRRERINMRNAFREMMTGNPNATVMNQLGIPQPTMQAGVGTGYSGFADTTLVTDMIKSSLRKHARFYYVLLQRYESAQERQARIIVFEKVTASLKLVKHLVNQVYYGDVRALCDIVCRFGHDSRPRQLVLARGIVTKMSKTRNTKFDVFLSEFSEALDRMNTLGEVWSDRQIFAQLCSAMEDDRRYRATIDRLTGRYGLTLSQAISELTKKARDLHDLSGHQIKKAANNAEANTAEADGNQGDKKRKKNKNSDKNTEAEKKRGGNSGRGRGRGGRGRGRGGHSGRGGEQEKPTETNKSNDEQT